METKKIKAQARWHYSNLKEGWKHCKVSNQPTYNRIETSREEIKAEFHQQELKTANVLDLKL